MEGRIDMRAQRLNIPLSMARRYLSGPGSSPPRCTSKCGRCTPCKPVHVPVPPGTPVTTEYYPEAWRCKCGNRLYMPWKYMNNDHISWFLLHDIILFALQLKYLLSILIMLIVNQKRNIYRTSICVEKYIYVNNLTEYIVLWSVWKILCQALLWLCFEFIIYMMLKGNGRSFLNLIVPQKIEV